MAEARTTTAAQAQERPEPPAVTLLKRPIAVWSAAMAALVAGALLQSALGPKHGLPEVFFKRQDFFVVGLSFVMLGALVFAPAKAPRLAVERMGWRGAALVAAAVALAAWGGSWLLLDHFALTTDEALALFDARILASGRLAAPVPPQWQAYVPAMMPLFGFPLPGHAYWLSNYLPVNAAFLALASKVHAESLMAPLWAALGVLATFGVARRLWPERPAAAAGAALLLATTPQVLITAMTPYAMSAHLALNMAWLWLVLRGGRTGHGAAAGVAFLATGLHQVVFNPLFAAPFLLEMGLERRWKPALWHTLAYAAIGLFWVSWPIFIAKTFGGPAVTAEAAQAHGLLAQAADLMGSRTWDDAGLMVKNLIRFATWQSLIAAPLALAALVPAFRAGGAVRAMALGLVLTTGAVFLLMPYQGHGWGYRYLHGLEGSVALLAAWALSRAGPAPAAPGRDAPDARPAVFAAGLALTLLVLLPIRLWQAQRFTAPYAAAERAIQAEPAEAVLVEDAGLWYGADLVRNDPFLARRPVELHAANLTAAEALALCAKMRVAVFTPKDAQALGVGRSDMGEPAIGAATLSPEACAAARRPHPIPDNGVRNAPAENGRAGAAKLRSREESSRLTNFQRPDARPLR